MRKIYFFLACIIFAPFLQGCPKSTPTIKEDYEVNKWVYSVMAKSYFWSDEMPEFNDSGAETAGTQDYFDRNLRYRVNLGVSYENDTYGDRFSQIEFTGNADAVTRTQSATEQENDFGFLLSQITDANTGSILHMQVLYVIPGTSADKAGLKRGDIFDEVNGTRITRTNLESLFAENEIKITVLNRQTGELTIRRELYYDDPILMDTIYTAPEKTAYLIYNHFTNGDGNAGYADKLIAAFGRYKTAGVETLILDLRYNGGGEIYNAQLLASLIAPPNMLGEEFMRGQRNASVGVKYWENFDVYKLLTNYTNYNVANFNADIKNLYIITSRYTASASELIIHTLRPIFRNAGRTLRVVGETTYGKNVGSYTYIDSRYDWEISPISMMVYNLDKVSGYEEGLAPDTGNEDSEYIYRSGVDHYILPPLGDFESEKLLNIVVRHFYNVPAAVRSGTTRGSESFKPVPMILERGLSGGVVLID